MILRVFFIVFIMASSLVQADGASGVGHVIDKPSECFAVVNGPIRTVGFQILIRPATRVCPSRVVDKDNNHYASISFSDEKGSLASVHSSSEVIQECRGFCHIYQDIDSNTYGPSVGMVGIQFTVIESGESQVGNLIIGGTNYTVRPITKGKGIDL